MTRRSPVRFRSAPRHLITNQSNKLQVYEYDYLEIILCFMQVVHIQTNHAKHSKQSLHETTLTVFHCMNGLDIFDLVYQHHLPNHA